MLSLDFTFAPGINSPKPYIGWFWRTESDSKVGFIWSQDRFKVLAICAAAGASPGFISDSNGKLYSGKQFVDFLCGQRDLLEKSVHEKEN
jgi:hypothetical protein